MLPMIVFGGCATLCFVTGAIYLLYGKWLMGLRNIAIGIFQIVIMLQMIETDKLIRSLR